MSATRAQMVEELFANGVDLTPDARAAFLESKCGADHKLRSEVEALFHSDESQCEEFLSSPVVALEALPSGALIAGKYRSLRVLGEGGMGMVYLAEQQHPVRRRVAIKVIKVGMDTNQVIARFEAERQALAMMDHPSIARVLDAGATDTGRPFFVMELVRGVAITQYCDEQRLTTRERIELFLPVVDAIQHAHHKGVIHRDIKPGNIIVTLDSGRPVAKVIDFGVAKATSHRLTEKTLFTAHGQLIGTPEYMSPEQAGMSDLDIDTRSDVYSLGAVLYEILTGSKPFRASSAGFLDIQRRICDVDPMRPSTRVTRVLPTEPSSSESAEKLPPTGTAEIARLRRTDPVSLSRELRRDLDWIIARAMEKDRTRRYETSSALGADLRRFLMNQPVEARPPSAVYRVRKFSQRNRAAVTGGILVLLVLVAGIVATTTFAVGESRQRSRTATALAAEKTAKDAAMLQEMLASDAAESAEQAAAKAEAVNLFLEAMITSARTQSSRGRDVTMREVLDATTQRLDSGQLADLPMVEEEIRDIIGRTYMDLGFPTRASANLRWVYDYSVQTRGDTADQSLEALDVYADAVKEQVSNQDIAIELHERLYALTSQVRGVNDPSTLLALDGLANSMMRDGRASEAIPMHQIARRGLIEHYGKDDPRTVLPLFNIGGCQRLLGDYENAERTYREVIDVFDESGWNLSAVRGRIELASGVLLPMGQEQKAVDLLREADEMGRRLLGQDHSEVISGRIQLARILWKRGDPEGKLVFDSALETRKRLFGSESMEYAAALLDYGRLLMDVDKNLAGARQALTDAYDVFLNQPDATRLVTSCASQLALISLIHDDHRRAEQYAIALREAAIDGYGDNHDYVIHADRWRGLALVGLGRASEAEPILREVLRLISARYGDTHHETGRALWSLGHCLDALGQDEQAERLLVDGYRLHVAGRLSIGNEALLAKRYLEEFFASRGRSDDLARLRLGP